MSTRFSKTLPRYRLFIERLRDVDRHLKTGDVDSLVLCQEALRAVLHFIREDEVLAANSPVLALNTLFAAIANCVEGSKPSLFFDRPRQAGRPTRDMFHVTRGYLAYALDRLMRAGMKNREAVAWMAAELERRGVYYKGKLITARDLKQWREQVNDSGPRGANEAFAKADEQFQGVTFEDNIKAALAVAETCIKGAERWNSNKPPFFLEEPPDDIGPAR